MYLILLLSFSACVGGGGPSSEEKPKVGNSFVVQNPGSTTTFEGTPLSFQVVSKESTNGPRSILWEITDEWGQIATPYFHSDNGSVMILAGSPLAYISIIPLKGMIPIGGKTFLLHIHIGKETYVQEFRVRNFFDEGDDDGTIHTVTIDTFDNNKLVNRINQKLYFVGGACSTFGGGVLVNISRGGKTATKTETCGSNNRWQVGLDLSALPDGVLSVNVKHSIGGSIGQANSTITKDTLPPSVEILFPAANSGIKLLNVSNFSVSGSCSDNNQIVTVQARAGSQGADSTTTECFDFKWSTVLDVSSLPDGPIRVSAHHSDAAGNSSSTERNYVKDTIIPLVTITSPANGTMVNVAGSASTSFSGTCSENGSRILLSGDTVHSTPVICSNNIWSVTNRTITGADGAKIITATVTDIAGNVSYANVGLIKQTALPTAVLTNLPQENDEQLNIRVGGDNVTHYRYKIGDDELNCGTSSGYSSATPISTRITDNLGSDGDKKICVLAIDIYDNTQAYSSATVHTWTKDTTVTNIFSFTSPAANTRVDSSNMANFSVSGVCSLDGEEVKLTGAFDSASAICTGDAWSVNLDLTAIPEGPVVVAAEHGSMTATRTFQKIISAPQINFTHPGVNAYINKNNRTNLKIEGQCNIYSDDPNIVVTGGLTPVSVACNGATWTAFVTFENEVTKAITVTATMTDSDDGEVTTTRSFNLDTIAPLVAFTSPAEGSYITNTNAFKFPMKGDCSEDGIGTVEITHNSVVIDVVNCTLKKWEAELNLLDIDDGVVTLAVGLSDMAGNKAQAFRNFEKTSGNPVAELNGTPDAISDETSLNIYVSGSGVTQYRYKLGDSTLNCSVAGGYSTPRSASIPITDPLGTDGHKKICVLGLDLYGSEQLLSSATTYSWIKEAILPDVSFLTPAEYSYININNESSFVVTGECAINGAGNVKVGSGVVSVDVDCIDKKWTATLNLSSLPDGTVEVKASQSSILTGVVAEKTRTFNKFTVAPTIEFTSPTENSHINIESAPSFTVVGECNAPSASIAVTGADATVYATCDGSNWTATLSFTGIAEATRAITATLTDIAGNEVSTNRSFLLDTIAPTVKITSPGEGEVINSLNQESFNLSGTCTVNGAATGTILFEDAPIATFDCFGPIWNVDVDVSGLPDGSVMLTAVQFDEAGNKGSDPRNFFKNTFKPTAVLQNLPDPVSPISVLNVEVGGLNVSSYLYKLGDDTLDCSDESGYLGPYTISQLIQDPLSADGPKKLCARGIDIYGNTQSLEDATVYEWIKETNLPAVSFLTPAEDSNITTDSVSSFVVTGKCGVNGVGNVRLEWGVLSTTVNCASQNWTATLDMSSLSDGPVEVKAIETSLFSHLESEATRTFNKYTVVPTVTILTPDETSYINLANRAGFTLTGECNIAGAEIALTGGSTTVNTTCNGINWTATLTFPVGPETTKTVTATMTDVVGKTGTDSKTYPFDTTAPIVSIELPGEEVVINSLNHETFHLSGTCSADGEATGSIHHGVTEVATFNCESGEWNVDVDVSGIPDGDITLVASQSDDAGNMGMDDRTYFKHAAIPTAVLQDLPPAVSGVSDLNVRVEGTNVTAYIYKLGDNTLNCAVEDDYQPARLISELIEDSLVGDGPKRLCVRGMDDHGNIQPLATATVYNWTKETIVPEISFVNPADNSYINIDSASSFIVAGACNITDGPIVVTGGTTTVNTTCNGTSWTAELAFSEVTELVTKTITATLTHEGNDVVASRNFRLDTLAPDVSIDLPGVEVVINSLNHNSFPLEGTCSTKGEATGFIHHGMTEIATFNCESGEWNVDVDVSGIPDGDITLVVSQSDEAGNKGVDDRTYTKIATTPTAVLQDLPGAVSEDSALDVKVEGTNVSSYVYKLGDNTLNCAVEDDYQGPHAISVRIEDPITVAGPKRLCVRGIDVYGNIQPLATATVYDWIKGATEPIISFQNPAANSYINIENAGGFIVSGMCNIADAAIALTGGDAQVDTTCDGTSWTATLAFSEIAESTTKDITATLTNGGDVATDERSFRLDTVAPAVSISSPAPEVVITTLNHNSFPLQGTCSANGETTGFIHHGVTQIATFDCESGAWNVDVDVSALSDGSITLVASQYDEAGNKGTGEQTYTKHTATPTAVLQDLPPTVSSISALNVRVEGLNVTHYDYKLGDGTIDCGVAAGYSGSRPISQRINDTIITDGPKTLCVRGIDEHGNIQPLGSATVYNWTKGTIVPEISLVNPVADSYINIENAGSFIVSGLCNITGATIEVTGGDAQVDTTCDGANWTANLAFAEVAELVTKTITAKLIHEGTEDSDSREFNFDTVAPTTSFTSPVPLSIINTSNKDSFALAGTCTENGTGTVSLHFESTLIATTDCNTLIWSDDVDLSTLPDGNVILTVSQTDEAGNKGTPAPQTFIKNTIVPTAVLEGLPTAISADEFLNVEVKGLTVTSYLYKFGDDTIDCGNAADYQGPRLISQRIVDEITTDGPKTLCVRGRNANNDIQPLEDATVYSWVHDSGYIPEPVEEGDLEWFYPFAGMCVGENNSSDFHINGACAEGGGNITVTSPQIPSLEEEVGCFGGEFDATLEGVDISELADGSNFSLKLSQGSAESSLEFKVFKETNPTIVFGGWDDVIATGKKTYKNNSRPSEEGEVWFSWKEWPKENTCLPQGIKVYRSSDKVTFDEVTTDAFDHETFDFHDDTLEDTDFGKAWYYRLSVLIAGNEYPVTEPNEIASIRIIAPPANTALVHRWIANQSICSYFPEEGDPEKNYSCIYDLGHDLIVDRFEAGCNYSETCGEDENELCVGDLDEKLYELEIGWPGKVGSVFYDNSSEEGAGGCFYKYGEGDMDWDHALETTDPTFLNKMTSNEANLPPFASIDQAKAQTACSAHSIELVEDEESVLVPYKGNTNNTFPVNKRLLRQYEWRAAAEWDREDALEIEEAGAGGNAEGNRSANYCNTIYDENGHLHSDPLLGFALHGRAFETGSISATSACVSRYGLQDMVGNLWEWTSDQVQCTGGGNCVGVTSALDSGNTEIAGMLFNGVDHLGPSDSEDAVLEPGEDYQYLDWYHNVFNGLSYLTPAEGLIDLDDVPFNNWGTFHLMKDNGTKGLKVGGSWDQVNGRGSRWSTDLSYHSDEDDWDISFRCMIPVK